LRWPCPRVSSSMRRCGLNTGNRLSVLRIGRARKGTCVGRGADGARACSRGGWLR
jgi:hypothetical protein